MHSYSTSANIRPPLWCMAALSYNPGSVIKLHLCPCTVCCLPQLMIHSEMIGMGWGFHNKPYILKSDRLYRCDASSSHTTKDLRDGVFTCFKQMACSTLTVWCRGTLCIPELLLLIHSPGQVVTMWFSDVPQESHGWSWITWLGTAGDWISGALLFVLVALSLCIRPLLYCWLVFLINARLSLLNEL